MSSSVHVDKKKNYIQILGDGATQELDGTTFSAEKMYLMKFTKNNDKFCLSLHYNAAKSYLFINGT